MYFKDEKNLQEKVIFLEIFLDVKTKDQIYSVHKEMIEDPSH